MPSAATGPWREELPLSLPLFITQVTKWLRLCKLCSRPGISPRNLMAAVLIAELCMKFSLRRGQLHAVRVCWAVHSPGAAAWTPWRQRTTLTSLSIGNWGLCPRCTCYIPNNSHTPEKEEGEFFSCRHPREICSLSLFDSLDTYTVLTYFFME